MDLSGNNTLEILLSDEIRNGLEWILWKQNKHGILLSDEVRNGWGWI